MCPSSRPSEPLALSGTPALRAIGLVTGIGVLLSLVLAPLSLVVTGATRTRAEDLR